MKSSISKSLLVILLISLPITNTFSAPKTLEEIAVEALRAEIAEYPRASEITIYQYGTIMLALSDLKSAFNSNSTIQEDTFDTLLLLFSKDESVAIRIKIGEVLAKLSEVTAGRSKAVKSMGELLELKRPAQIVVQLKIAELLLQIGGVEAVTALSTRAINMYVEPTSEEVQGKFIKFLRDAFNRLTTQERSEAEEIFASHIIYKVSLVHSSKDEVARDRIQEELNRYIRESGFEKIVLQIVDESSPITRLINRAFREGVVNIRGIAAATLAELAETAALAELEEVLGNEGERTREKVAEEFRKILLEKTGERFQTNIVALLDDPFLDRDLRLRIETVTGALFGYDVLSKKGINTLLPAIINLGSQNGRIAREASAAITDIPDEIRIPIEELSRAYDIYRSYMVRPARDDPTYLLLFIPAKNLFDGALIQIENGTFWQDAEVDGSSVYINVDDQIAGLRYVAKVKGEGAIEYLIAALGSNEERVREAARESIGTIARDMLDAIEAAPSNHKWGRSWDRLEVLYKINNLKTYSPYIFYELSRFAFTTQFTDSAREARNYLRNSADYLEILIDSENPLHRAFALHALVATDDLRELVIGKTVELTRESESSHPETQRIARETLKQIHIILQKRLNTSFLDRNRIKAARLLAKIPKEAALTILMFSLIHQNADNEWVGNAILGSIEEILNKIEPVVKEEKLESLKSEAKNSGLKKESRDLAQRILNYLAREEGPLQTAVSQPALNLLRKAKSVTTGAEETTKGSSSWRDFFKRLGEGKLGKGRPK